MFDKPKTDFLGNFMFVVRNEMKHKHPETDPKAIHVYFLGNAMVKKYIDYPTILILRPKDNKH